jgi:valyl-tRNA synthetase
VSDLQAKSRYDPSEVEPRIAARWLAAGIHHPAAEGTAAENYSIAIPPPNVTGALHMGHALNGAIQDTLIRYQRMGGRRCKWILGTDHAGIATQTQVERMLATEGTGRRELGREAFEQRVWDWRERYGGTIIEQLKRLGASCDYDEERFTLDPAYAAAVQRVFVALYQKGYIYRDRYLVNWDPGSRSAISDLEVESQEVTDTLCHIDYPLADGSGAVTVATVRPETMLADSAVAVHPQDERYAALVGREAILPLVGRRLPIIADEHVRRDFGSGALKITPGHDPNDFEIGRRHGLEQITVIGEDGRMIAPAPQRFCGLSTAEAARAVLGELRAQDLLRKTEPYTHAVPFSERSGQRIEPLISLQWFMRMDELAAPAIEAVRSGRVRFYPERWARVYLEWMENIRPWVLSRQLWWGHRLPVYYRGAETHVGAEPPAGEGWQRDPDVLDTWFSSALWPFATLGWPEQTPELRAFYPTDLLVTARDIIFLWVARMIMMGLEFTGEVPFSDVYIHSVIQAPDGRRMSKSLGTGVDPLDLINGGLRPPVFAPERGGDPGSFPAYGADAVRWGLLAMSSGQDVRFAEDKVAQGQQLTNKLFNAARLVLLRADPALEAQPRPVSVEDRWILSRLRHAHASVSERLVRYEFSHAALELYDFVFGELCDWYLELVKHRLYAGEAEVAGTLLYLLRETLILAHPLIPFVTEELWSHLPGASGLLAAQVRLPLQAPEDPEAEAELGRLIEAVRAIRGWRDSAQVRPGATLGARLAAAGYESTSELLARQARLAFTSDGTGAAVSVPIPGGSVEILAGAELDLEAVSRRREAARARLAAEIERAERKLANPGFVAKAPEPVVDAERQKLERLRTELEAL